LKPQRIANSRFEIQIVDTHGILKTRISIGFQADDPQINRTLVNA